MSMQNIKVMIAGHICLDITPVFDANSQGGFGEIFSPGKLINVGPAVFSTGGAVANVGLTMSKLGIDVLLNGKVGDDEIGALIGTLLEDRGGALQRVSDQHSSYSIVLALPGVDRVFLHNPGTNDTFTSDDIDYQALKDCSLFHFGYPPLMKRFYENNGEELANMFQQAKAAGVVTSLDMTLPDPQSPSGQVDWHMILKRCLPYVDIFLPSIEEIAFMLDRELFEQRKAQAGGQDPVFVYTASDCSRLADNLIEMGVSIVAIKNGIRGYYLQTAGIECLHALEGIANIYVNQWSQRQLWASSYKADQIASATGAGDATIAGFLSSFLRGLTPMQSLNIANMVGLQNVRQMDAVSGIEDWKTTLSMVADKTHQRNELTIKDDGWRYDDKEQIFYGPAGKYRKV